MKENKNKANNFFFFLSELMFAILWRNENL